MKISKRQLLKIVQEERRRLKEMGYYNKLPKNHVDGSAWPGPLEDLAREQTRSWGGGKVVDMPGFKNDLSRAHRLSKGKDSSPLRSAPGRMQEKKDALQEYLEDFGGDKGAHVVDYLKGRARVYHADRSKSLDVDGDGMPDASAIKVLLQDDFMDNYGHEFDMVDFDYEISNFAHGAGLKEAKKMKLTKRQLRRIIKEELQTLKEQSRDPRGAQASQGTGWDNFTPEGESEDEMYLAAEDMPELLKVIDRNQKQAASNTDPSMASMYEDDAGQLQTIYDMSEKAFGAMQTTPPEQLSNYISRLDTMVREQIPENIYNWIVGQR